MSFSWLRGVAVREDDGWSLHRNAHQTISARECCRACAVHSCAAAEFTDESCWHLDRPLRNSELAERSGRRICIPRRNLSDVVCGVACAPEECAVYEVHSGRQLHLVLSARAHLDCFHPVASRWTQLAAHRARPRVDAHAFVRLALAFPLRARSARSVRSANRGRAGDLTLSPFEIFEQPAIGSRVAVLESWFDYRSSRPVTIIQKKTHTNE